MMTPRSKGIGTYFDKLLLGLCLLGLVGSLGYMFTAGGGFGYRGGGDHRQGGNKAEPQDFQARSNEWSKLTSSVAFTQTNRVLSSEDRIQCLNTNVPLHYISTQYKDRNCPVCNHAVVIDLDSDRDGMLDSWEEVSGLDRANKTDAGWDPDKDGYTNLEEFSASPKTHPRDPDSHPPYIDALRTYLVRDEPLVFKFMAVTEASLGNFTFQVSILGQRPVLEKIGGTPGGWTIHKYDEKKQVLTIKRDDRQFDLPRRQQVRIPQRRAVIGVITNPEKRWQLAKGDEMDLDGQKYKVVDIGANSVLLSSIAGKEQLVPKASAEEIEKFKRIKAGNFPGPA
jgi:hypothetical protein